MKRALSILTVATLCAFGHLPAAMAVDYALPAPGSRLIGYPETYVVPDDGKNLESIAQRFDTGILLLLEANNTVDPFLPKPGSELVIPNQMILPDTPHEGIVVNLAELRLYYYPPNTNRVEVYPLGIGQLGRETPEMITRISQKIPNPTWTPTASIRARSQAAGINLPAVIPAGPNNPLGHYAMRLEQGGGEYLIHGTNKQTSVGQRVSSGCMRMRAADIKALFSQVAWGTRVQIVNEPVKYTTEPDGRRYIEVHQPLSTNDWENPQTVPIAIRSDVGNFIDSQGSNRAEIEQALIRRAGYPVEVGNLGRSLPIQSTQNAVIPVSSLVKTGGMLNPQ